MLLDLDLLASIASGGLGQWVQDKSGKSAYVKSDDCLGCLRDLCSFFRDDDDWELRPAFFAVSKYNLARSDLVPLIVTHPDDYELVYNALKACTFLTMAPPGEAMKTTRTWSAQTEHMRCVAEAFLAQDALAAVVGLVAEPLSRHPRMTPQDGALVQLVLSFLRNLVAIPEPASQGVVPHGGAGGARVRSGLLDRLFADNAMDLMLLLGQHAGERPFRSEGAELVKFFLGVFQGIDPGALLGAEEKLAAANAERARQAAAAKRGAAATTAHLPRLAPPRPAPLLHRSMVSRAVAAGAPARHSRSDAVYVRRHVEHSTNIVVRHNPHRPELPAMPSAANAKQAQAQKREGAGAGRSGSGLGPALHAQLARYMESFLGGGAYNVLMATVFRELQPGLHISRLEAQDFENFVRLATLCTRYVRLREEAQLSAKLLAKKGPAAAPGTGSKGAAAGGGAGAGAAAGGEAVEGTAEQEARAAAAEAASPFACVSSTLGWDSFQWLLTLWITLTGADAKEARQVDRAGEKNWSLQHASVPLLKEMMLVLDLARVAGPPADRRASDRLHRRLLHDDHKESGLLPVLSKLIRGYNFRFQPRSHAVDLAEALHVVLATLDRLSAAEGGGFRVRRNAGPSRKAGKAKPRKRVAPPPPKEGAEKAAGAGEAEGAEGGGETGEGSRDKGEAPATAEGGDAAEPAEGAQGGRAGSVAPGEEEEEAAAVRPAAERYDPFEGEEEEEEGEEGGEEDAAAEAQRASREVHFEAPRRLREECALPAVIHFHTWLLEGYATNAALTNHALLSFLERIAAPGGLNLEPMLYQMSVLRLFQAILADPAARRSEAHAPLLAFCTRVTRNLFARLVPDLSKARAAAAGPVAVADPSGAANLQQRFDGAESGGGPPQEGEQAAPGPDAAADADAAADGSDPQAAADAAEAAEAARKRAEVEVKVREEAASLMFIELLFWKGHRVAEDMREEYHWRKVVDPAPRRGGGSGSEGGRQVGFATASRRDKAPLFSGEQEARLQAAFESCNGSKDCLARCVAALGGAWSKAQVSRQLKAMRLARGKLTGAQVAEARRLYEEHRGQRDWAAVVAEELGAGFSGGQVKRQLTALGLLPGKTSKAAARKQAADWDAMLGDDNSSDSDSDSDSGSGGGGGRAKKAAGAGATQSLGAAARGGGSGSDSDSGSSASSGSDAPLSDDGEGAGAAGGVPNAKGAAPAASGADADISYVSLADMEDEEAGGDARLGPEATQGLGPGCLAALPEATALLGEPAPPEARRKAKQQKKTKRAKEVEQAGSDGGDEGDGAAPRSKPKRAKHRAQGADPAAQADARDISAKRAAALEALRRKRTGGADPPVLAPATEPLGPAAGGALGMSQGGDENMEPAAAVEGEAAAPAAPAAVVMAGRRLMRKGGGGGGGGAAAPAPLPDFDLEDF